MSGVAQARFEPGTVDVLEVGAAEPPLAVGAVSPEAGEAAFRYVVRAIELAMAGEVDATVTNPLNKEALNAAGHHFAGHTELYAAYTRTPDYTMMLALGNLRVVHVSTHVSLREACDRVKKARVLKVIRIAHAACRDMGIARPRIGVAGLNPMPGRTACSAGRRLRRSNPRYGRPGRRTSTPAAPCRRTRCFPRRAAAGTTRWSPCTTIRGTSRSRCWALSTTPDPAAGKRSAG